MWITVGENAPTRKNIAPGDSLRSRVRHQRAIERPRICPDQIPRTGLRNPGAQLGRPTLVPRLRACRGHPRCFAATRRREAEFGGHGPRTTGAFFELLGYRPGVLFAVIAGLTEAGGGVMLAVGLLTPLAGAAVVGVMLNAASTLRGRGPWVINDGWAYTVVLATVGASIALSAEIDPGPGSPTRRRTTIRSEAA
jgi:hypothetical protein